MRFATGGKTVRVVWDEASMPSNTREGTPQPQPCRWWPHGGNCSHWHQTYGNNSARVVDTWAWTIQEKGTTRQYAEPESAVTKKLLEFNATHALYQSSSARLTLRDEIVLRGDAVYITVSATNLLNTPVRATFLTQYGSLQLGPNQQQSQRHAHAHAQSAAGSGSSGLWHLGNKRLGSLDRNWSTVEACVYPYDGYAPMPSRACFSAVSAMGDAATFSAGFQLLTPIDPDDDDALMAYMDVPANPRTPTSTTTLTVDLQAAATRTFTLAMQLSPPSPGLERDAVLSSMEKAVAPYVTSFHTRWGDTPTYCPSPSSSWEDSIDYGLNRKPVCKERYPGMECNPYGKDTVQLLCPTTFCPLYPHFIFIR